VTCASVPTLSAAMIEDAVFELLRSFGARPDHGLSPAALGTAFDLSEVVSAAGKSFRKSVLHDGPTPTFELTRVERAA